MKPAVNQKQETQSHGNAPGVLPDASSVWLPLTALVPWAGNPRRNDGLPVAKVAESIRTFGFVAPFVVWRAAGRMVAGHTRLKAMQRLLKENPSFTPKGAPGPGLARVVFHDFKDEAEADLYALADNKLGELAAWDDEAVAGILARYSDDEVALAGFDDEEIPAELAETAGGEDDADLEPPAEPTTRLGDIYQLSEHRLLCGDSTKPEDVARLMDGATADMVWTDPPYGVSYTGTAKPRGGKPRADIEGDSMDDDELAGFLAAAFGNAFSVCVAGGAWYVAAPPGPAFLAFGATLRRLEVWRQTLTWLKQQFVIGRSDYHYRHEPIFYGWKPGAAHHALTDRTQDTVWECPRPRDSALHPTMKPVELIERAITNSSSPGALVLDLFGGSGSTLIAAAKTGRRAYLIELSPAYCDVIVKRWETATGKTAERIPASVAA